VEKRCIVIAIDRAIDKEESGKYYINNCCFNFKIFFFVSIKFELMNV